MIAYRALMRSEGNYDVIVSQPSHVWVSGAEMLFSKEFLEAAKSKLAPGGVHCQWLQGYEIGDEAVEVVLQTYRSVFPDMAIWHGSQDPGTPRFRELALEFGPLPPARAAFRQAELQRNSEESGGRASRTARPRACQQG